MRLRAFALAILCAPVLMNSTARSASSLTPHADAPLSPHLCVERRAAGWGIGQLDAARHCMAFGSFEAATTAIRLASDKAAEVLNKGEGAVQMAAPFAVTSTPTCQSTDGAYAPTSMAFFPTCYGLFSAAAPRYLTYATRGANSVPGSHPPVPSTETNGLSQVLIQGKTVSSRQSEQLLTLNYDVDRGAPTAASIDKVALQLYMNCHQSLDGRHRPGACWAFNPDIRFEQGAGPLFGTVAEFDMNLADEYCGPNSPSGPGCAIYSLWFNGFNLYPQTATIRMEGIPTSYRGIVDVHGSIVTARQPFGNSLAPGFNTDTTTLYINDKMYHVQHVITKSELQLASNLGAIQNAPAYWQPHTTKDAILITGDNYAATSVMQANTAAYYGITLGGSNVIALDVSRNASQFGLFMSPQQKVAFNGFDDYQMFAGHDEHQFLQNGQVTFAIDGARNALDWLGVSNAGKGEAPTLSVRGFDADSNLGLQPKGEGAVAVLSKALSLRPTRIAELPPCRAKSKGWVAFVSDPSSSAKPGFDAVVSGGGTVIVNHLAGCDGTDWRYQ